MLPRLLPGIALTSLVLLTGLLPAHAAPTPGPTPAPTAAPTRPAPAARTSVNQLPVQAVDRAAAPRVEAAGERPAGRVSAALPARQTAPFSMLGVTWAPGSAPAPHVAVRLLQRGVWSDWQELHADPDTQTDDPTARPGTSPTFVGEATGVEVRAVTEDSEQAPADLKAVLIDPKTLATDSVPTTQPPATTRAAAGQAPMPTGIISRAGWGADESLKSSCPAFSKTVHAVVVHHTEGTNNYTKDQSAGIVRGIYAYHVQGNGWCDIGYNYLIDKYGQIFEGRSGGMTMPVKGAHAVDWNTDTMGISLLGSFTTELPPEVALDAAVRLSAWRLAAYYRDATARITINGVTSNVISGHRQVVATDCPGEAFYNYLPTFRQRVVSTMGSISTPIKARWDALGGAAGPAGEPYVGEAPIATGRVTQFTNYDIFSVTGVRTSFTKGDIRAKHRQLGSAKSFLGFPTIDEVCGLRDGGCYTNFQGGAILWSPTTGAHPNAGAIRMKYADLGFENSTLGYPISDEFCGLRDGGCFQDFQGGTIMWSPKTGAVVNRGPIRAEYGAKKFEAGPFGWPVADEVCSTDGCVQDFQRGSILWSKSTGARTVWGAIGIKYAELGRQQGPLGYPTGGEVCGRDGGCYQPFQRGVILWSPQSGAHPTWGAIQETYGTLDFEHGVLGYPTSDEYCGLRDGGCNQNFAGGAILWSPSTGAHENLGAIRMEYARLGYENSRLGYPTTGEVCSSADHCEQRFSGGRILWDRAIGARVG
ncbi:hypothetical protein CGZ93_09680 [Enemella dayhoffiae]|uniref:LGFP repeat-containing protein n=1 Tax=Enemella dayhoffiae TaxID=2016507 RepID=A0A255H363_9ACTN|nr:N-acetylmuramoyl-L-alanine amidase [Enemella dayhoffiae]OYO22155.1 hypothetical protein CGZ93_09680 [Enemella dayhoffiae]